MPIRPAIAPPPATTPVAGRGTVTQRGRFGNVSYEAMHGARHDHPRQQQHHGGRHRQTGPRRGSAGWPWADLLALGSGCRRAPRTGQTSRPRRSIRWQGALPAADRGRRPAPPGAAGSVRARRSEPISTGPRAAEPPSPPSPVPRDPMAASRRTRPPRQAPPPGALLLGLARAAHLALGGRPGAGERPVGVHLSIWPASAAGNCWPTAVPMAWNSGIATNWMPV